MAKRDLSDEEIGLIKGMLAKGMGNDEAHAYFNRFDRLFSSGRISNIKLGKYGPDVPAADAAAVDAFIANFKLNSAKHNSKRSCPKAWCSLSGLPRFSASV